MERSVDVELRNLTKTFGDVVAVDRVSLRIEQGEFFSLLGPSGCGKTSTLRMIAGFEHPTSGEIWIRSRPMGQTPPFRRDVNTVFQHYALFPHMTVAENVAFGLRMKRVSRSEAGRRVQEALALVRLVGYDERRPRQLSGGQQQRVALARALVNRPAVLLLDEPLGALDLKLRKAMQQELKRLQGSVGITFVYVTHDQEEALTMSDRIAVMHDGRVLQVATPAEIYERPTSRFVADFIGETNFLDGEVVDIDPAQSAVVVLVDRTFPIRANLPRPADGIAVGTRVTLAIRPEKARIAAVDADLGDRRAAVRGRVEEAIYIGADTSFLVRLSDRQSVRVRRQNRDEEPEDGVQPAPGQDVTVWWSPDSVRLLTT